VIFRRKRRNGGTALAERAPDVTAEFSGDDGELFAEIEALTDANRSSRDLQLERRLLRLRHLAGIRLLDQSSGGVGPEHPIPDFDRLPAAEGLPEVAPSDLTPELLRAGILRDGSLLVRGLIAREEALHFAQEVDRSFTERDRHDAGSAPVADYYEEFDADRRFSAPMSRDWIKVGGGVLAADSPRLMFEMLDLFSRAGFDELIPGYLGERPAITTQKTTLRKADPSVPGGWHQDGAFMGDVRSLNVWVSLSRCGDEAPGLDIVPRRLDDLVELGGEGTILSYQVSQRTAEEAAGDTPIVRPIFEPGDVLLFDDLCLHQTAADPSMPNPRYAIESWFFGPSAFPGDYAPLAY
jgi:hypothetical protein